MGDQDDPTKTSTIGTDLGHVVGAVFNPAALGGALRELNIDAGTIEEILSALDDGESSMPRRLASAGGTTFGTLPRGVELARNTTLAQEYLQEAVLEMLQTLMLYFDGVRAFRDGTTTTDTYTADQLRRINRVVEQATTINHRQDRRHEGANR